jgi:hypothetical protein
MERGDMEMEGHDRQVSLSPFAAVSLFVLGGIIAGVALGCVAAKLNVAGFAPVGILPLAVGIALGSATGRLAKYTDLKSRKRLIVATISFAILTILAEHAWLYRDFCRQWREARASQAQVAMFRPEAPWSPAEYFAHEATPGRVALWCVDGALVVAGAVGAVIVSWRVVERSASQATRPT